MREAWTCPAVAREPMCINNNNKKKKKKNEHDINNNNNNKIMKILSTRKRIIVIVMIVIVIVTVIVIVIVIVVIVRIISITHIDARAFPAVTREPMCMMAAPSPSTQSTFHVRNRYTTYDIRHMLI